MKSPQQERIEYETGLTNSRFQNLLVVNGLWMLAFMTLASQPSTGSSVFALETTKTILFGIAIAAEITTTLSFSALCVGFKVIANIRNNKSLSWNSFFPISFSRGHIFVTPVLLTAFWVYLSYCALPAGTAWERLALYVPVGAAGLALTSFFWPRRWIQVNPGIEAQLSEPS